MKKRLLSLVLCLVMVFSLLPAFGVPALAEGEQQGVETADGYAQAGSNESWTMTDVQNWKANYISNAPYAEDGKLYVKVGENDYREVVIKEDNFYYVQQNNVNISDAFYSQTETQGNYHWEQDLLQKNGSSLWVYMDTEKGVAHPIYYNSFCKESSNYMGYHVYKFHIELFYYPDLGSGHVNEKHETSGAASTAADANFQAAVDDETVMLLNANGQPDTTKERWRFGHRVHGWTDSGKTETISGIYRTYETSGKNAMYYDDGTPGHNPVYMVRNWRSPDNPTDAWPGKLYYKVAENMIIDPETVPVTDDDPGDNTVTVANHNTITNYARANESGLKLSKKLAYNADSEAFDLTMESYSTVNVDKTNVTEKIPTDFVVVVDQSGSMDYVDMPQSYDKIVKMVDLETIAKTSEAQPGTSNANGYYYKAEDGNYYRVYAVQDYLYEYFAPNTKWTQDVVNESNAGLSWFQSEEQANFDVANQYYFRDESGARVIYRPITVSIAGKALRYELKFRYPDANREDVYFHYPDKPAYKPWVVIGLFNIHDPYTEGQTLYDTANDAVKDVFSSDDTSYTYATVLGWLTTGMYIDKPMYKRHVGYTKLAYRDVEGEEHIVTSASGLDVAEYCDASGNATTTRDATTRMWYSNLYTYHKSTNTSRVTALKYALNQFLTALANEKDTKTKAITPVENRVAIVGFSSSGYNTTEVMTGKSISAGGGVTKTTADNDVDKYYGGALLPATNLDQNGKPILGSVNTKLSAAVQSITANGGTQPELGLNMAYQILDNREETEYTMVTGDGDTVKRNTIVIFFTDGQPGDFSYSDQYKEANEAILAAHDIKCLKDKDQTPLNTTVFSIGVFGESDGNPLLYPRDKDRYGDPASVRENSDIEFEDGFIKKINDSGSYYYYMKRQWRSNADEAYGSTPNDTIYDYMSIVSSNYPNATGICTPEWIARTDQQHTTWLSNTNYARDVDSYVGSNKYYRMASNQDTLVAAFRQAVSIASSVVEGSSAATSLDDMAKFEDKIDTANFDVSEATYSVTWQPIQVLETAVPTVGFNGMTMIADYSRDDGYTGDDFIEQGKYPKKVVLANEPVPDSGVISYTGFDYSRFYVSKMKDIGYKLVVKVEGLKPLKYNTPMNSNADKEVENPETHVMDPVYACGIYPYGSDEARISIKSPLVTVFKNLSAYVVDFNAPLIIAKNATKLSAQKDGTSVNELAGTNGVFSLKPNEENAAVNDAVYQLNSGRIADKNMTLNIAYTTADSAWITGEHVDDGEGAPAAQEEVVVIPGSNIYFDDDLKNGDAKTIGDGSGWNVEVAASPAATDTEPGQRTITFSGTGIDIYCNTSPNGGYVQAMLRTASGDEVTGQPDQGIRNYDERDTRYNVPTLSYTGLPYGTYKVTLNVLSSSHYRLDGVRIYGAVQDQSIYKSEDPNKKYDKTEEQYAAFINLRDALINDGQTKGDVTIQTDETEENPLDALVGALFVDDGSKLQLQRPAYNAETGAPILDENGEQVYGWAYDSLFAAYQANSPKHEIYLTNGQMLVFQLAPDARACKLWIGLSAPDAGKNTGTVIITTDHAETVDVTSGVDMYYPIDLGESSTVTIGNSGTNMISITNLKITGDQDIYTAAITPKQNTPGNAVNDLAEAVSMVFEPVTMKTVRMAVNFGNDPAETDAAEPETPSEPTPTPTPDPTPSPEPTPDPTADPTVEPTEQPAQNWLSQLISNFVSMLFRSISRLFGN